MTCYFRHLTAVFAQAGIEVTRENKKELDRIIQVVVGGNPECSAVWRQVKKRLAEDESGFVSELKMAWANREPIKA